MDLSTIFHIFFWGFLVALFFLGWAVVHVTRILFGNIKLCDSILMRFLD